MNVTGKDRRRHARLPIDLQYILIVDDHEYSGHISNISLSGAYLATIEPNDPVLQTSQRGTLNIKTHKGWQSLRCDIVYVGSNDPFFPDGAGVAFCDEDDKTASSIWNLAIQYLVQDDQLFAPIND